MPLRLTLDAHLFHMIGGQFKRFAKARKDLLVAVNEMGSGTKMSTERPKDGDLQLASVADKQNSATASTALVEYKLPVFKEEEEDIEIKLRRILENVPVRVSNTSGSSAGSGSGDFHQYRQMRRKEQDRLSRMDADYQKRKEEAEFIMRREERLKAAEERTAKKRLKRQKKKQRKKEKKSKLNAGGEEHQNEQSSDDNDEDSDNDEDTSK